MVDYNDMYGYLKKARMAMLEALEKLSVEELCRDRGISFGSIRNVFTHTVIAEDNWLHHTVTRQNPWSQLRPEDFTSLSEIKNLVSKVEEKTDKLLSEITTQDLSREIKMIGADGKERIHLLEDILYQVPIQAIYHFGEIFAEFWRMNLEAPYYSYLTSYAPTKMASRR